jgi:SAM-dependent methyltransferase
VNEALQRETEKLIQSWMQHDAEMLRDYLVASVEDPRLNLQSVLSRHFLTRNLVPGKFEALMEQEYRFAAVMNWTAQLIQRRGGATELEAVLYALRHGADNAEGLAIPQIVSQSFARLPVIADEVLIPNYVESFLGGAQVADGQLHEPSLDTFSGLWRQALEGGFGNGWSSSAPAQIARSGDPPSVLEAACGSANDFRFLARFGMARWLDYTGFDLCEKNIQNARNLFPEARFKIGNVFEIDAPDKSYDFCLFHDLFEHLSLPGLNVALKEVCRVTMRGICAGFFNMDEIPEHLERPYENYHWNTLSMKQIREAFEAHGFAAQVLHIGTFLRYHVGCDETHNENAYTFWLRAR